MRRRAGEALRRRMTLERLSGSGDGGGGAAAEWRAVERLWVELRAIAGDERVIGEAEGARLSHRALMRWAPVGAAWRPTPRDRLSAEGRVFAIRAVTEADAFNRRLLCWVEEGASS